MRSPASITGMKNTANISCEQERPNSSRCIDMYLIHFHCITTKSSCNTGIKRRKTNRVIERTVGHNGTHVVEESCKAFKGHVVVLQLLHTTFVAILGTAPSAFPAGVLQRQNPHSTRIEVEVEYYFQNGCPYIFAPQIRRRIPSASPTNMYNVVAA